MGDFTGFTFGDWHSTDPNTGLVTVLRVSSGDRYEEELQPEVKDVTAEIPGLDGEYFFGSNYSPKKISIDVAFDSLTEQQFRQMRRAFGTKNIKQLIFDERPYKKYMAKIESPVELSYVCFDEPKKRIVGTEEGDERYGVRVVNRITETVTEDIGNALTDQAIVDDEEAIVGETVEHTIVAAVEHERIYPYEILEGTERIYKGEGKINFICYFPFAKSVYKELPYSYQLTTDTEIQLNKKYFKLEGMLYVVVAEPDVSEIDTYYERVTNEESKEWAISSGLLTVDQREGIDVYNSENQGIFTYNPGDLPVGFRLYIPGSIDATTISYKETSISDSAIASLMLDAITLKGSDIGILIDTNNQTIVGVSSMEVDENNNTIYTTTSNLYNEFITHGYFFQLEPNLGPDDYSFIEISNNINGIKIFYDYLYF